MIPSRFTATAVVLAALLGNASAAGITFKPLRAQPGQSIRLVTHSETRDGTIQQSLEGKAGTSQIEIHRDRELVWTFRDPLPDGTIRGMVRVKRIATTTKTTINSTVQDNTETSPLTGKMFSMSKTPTGPWNFRLDGSVPHARMRIEIESLETYLKRKWFPERQVELGDTWEFSPDWIKSIIRADLKQAQTVGTMRLRQIRRTQSGEYAVVDVSIRSTGGEFSADGTESTGAVKLDGEIIVNLRTMLDESLELKGSIISTTGTATQATKVTLPITLTAKKSFVNGTAFP